MYISFSHPLYLYFLFLVPLIVFFHFYGLKNIKGKAVSFANFDAITRIKGIDIYSKNVFLLVFNIIFAILLVLSLSGMSFHKEITGSEFSYVLAIDNSESMTAKDVSPSRLEGAKEVAIEFIDSLPMSTRAGVVSFSGDSSIYNELSTNKQGLKNSIKGVEISGTGGTDILDAVSAGAELLEKENNKAIILLGDGQINVGSVEEVVDYANYNDVMIHSIGIGSVEGGEVSYGLSKLDVDTLKAIAYNTGGKYYNINSKEELRESFNDIVEETEILSKFNLSPYLIIIVIILFIIQQYLLSVNKLLW